MVVNDFRGKVLFLDTAPLIYFIEGHSEYQKKLLGLFSAVDKGEFSFISSSLTLLEVLVKPIKEKREDLVEKFTDFLTSAKGFDLFDVNIDVARIAANLRAQYGLRTPDAIQIAVAKNYGADYFITNDTRLTRVADIAIVTLAEIE